MCTQRSLLFGLNLKGCRMFWKVLFFFFFFFYDPFFLLPPSLSLLFLVFISLIL